MKRNLFKDRCISALLVLAVVLALFVAMPREVHAGYSAADLADAINKATFADGEGKFHAEVSGNTVTVTGSVTSKSMWIFLQPADGVRVVWKAKYWVNGATVIKIHPQSGKSIFEVAEGADIVGHGSSTINVDGGGQCDILVSGGYIANERENGVCIDIKEKTEKQTVTVTGGTVTATDYNGKAIVSNGLSTVVNVKGGYVTARGGGTGTRAIELGSKADKSEVNVSGGDVWATRDAISVDAYNAIVNISGGHVRSVGETIGSGIYLSGSAGTGTVNVTGGRVGAMGSQTCHGICLDSDWSLVDISGGTVTSSGSKGGTVWVRSKIGGSVRLRGSGKVENTGTGRAILLDNNASSQVTVEGSSVVSAQSKQAILARLAELSGGFVFGIGSYTSLVEVYDGKPALSGTVIRCAWNRPASKPTYDEDSSEDLSVNPGATAVWALKSGKPGISYKFGKHTGFYPIGGITVKEAPPPSSTTTTAKTTTSTKTTTTTTTTAATTTTTTTTLNPTSWSPPDESSPSETSPLDESSPSETSLLNEATDPTSLPSPSDLPTESDSDDDKGGFNWLWLALIGLALLAIGGWITAFIFLRKKAKKE